MDFLCTVLLYAIISILIHVLSIYSEILISFEKYHRYDEMTSYLQNLSRIYNKTVTKVKLGSSTEGREIYAMKIGLKEQKDKPAILIDAGIHAREWMAPLTALYIIDQLVKKNDCLTTNVDWYIIPLLNPDGYEFSHQSKKNRLWRKNRKRQKLCYGVDLNRNFGFQWNTSEELEEQDNFYSCNILYGGSQPNSEVETQLLEKFVMNRRKNIKLYITLHAFGPFIFFPWAYTNDIFTNYHIHKALAENAARAIQKVRGTNYKVGTPGQLLYVASGSSMDWMAEVPKIPLTFAIELQASSQSLDPEVNERLNISKEFFEGLKEFHKFVENTWVLNTTMNG